MTHVTVPLPETVKHFIDEQVEEGGYRDPGEYLLALVRDAQSRAARRSLDAKLRAGLESPNGEMKADDWMQLRQRILSRHPGLKDE